jgi:coupling of ubiquitin conjugation to ER degradation protein 1
MFPDMPKYVSFTPSIRVYTMFFSLSRDNIRYDLLRTGNVELTSNKILEKGFLEAVRIHPTLSFPQTQTFSFFIKPPPPYYTLYPRTDGGADNNDNNNAPTVAGTTTGTQTSATKTPKENLISRYQLQNRVSTTAAMSSSSVLNDSFVIVPSLEQLGGKAVWEDSAEKREASLRERKAQMILAARQCVFSPFFLLCYEID